MEKKKGNKKENSPNKITVLIKRSYYRFLKIRGNPREIALGFALGLFVGMTPFMGFQTPIAIFFAAIFQWNKISSAVGVWISNPVTAPVIYGFNFVIGAKLTGLKASSAFTGGAEISLLNLLKSTPEILIALVLGGIITGIPLAIAGYHFSFSALNRYQEDIKIKLARQKERLAAVKQRRKLRKEKKQSEGGN